ncbi:hypothetical protein DEU56DRAFT_208000 [Suillus clintonianus]|uniref:uncharacterized protein n=1 Tax=Suillus clintonianus TaxID=1904413 RepID=UPI001B882531|nr:uncharacterized protein DEU56DRAFT_208000 [Suillus clintonianus]KAG2144533.1 hypothetical protein DEU56DRAFT_208000 [Suillus clintonianus]
MLIRAVSSHALLKTSPTRSQDHVSVFFCSRARALLTCDIARSLTGFQCFNPPWSQLGSGESSGRIAVNMLIFNHLAAVIIFEHSFYFLTSDAILRTSKNLFPLFMSLSSGIWRLRMQLLSVSTRKVFISSLPCFNQGWWTWYKSYKSINRHHVRLFLLVSLPGSPARLLPSSYSRPSSVLV